MLLKNLHQAIENSDSKALQVSAHSLKASSANPGAIGIAEHCKLLELMGCENRTEGTAEL